MVISVNPLAQPQGAIQTQFGLKKKFFLLNFRRIFKVFGDLRVTLFDIPKDVVFTKF